MSRVRTVSTQPWVIIGCGYTGTYVARQLLADGAIVTAEHPTSITVTRRTDDAATQLAVELGVRGVRVDLAEPATLEGVLPPGAVIICSAGPGEHPAEEMHALVAAAHAAGAVRIVYLSSTGVYGRAHGAWVDESAPAAPLSPTGEARVAAEAAIAASPVSSVALRIAGIHGPGRGLLDRMRAGTYRIVGDGSAHISRVHVEDLARVIIAAGLDDVTGAVNVADDDPAPIGEVADTMAARLGVAAPPRVPVESVSTEVAAMLTADRRISNAKMKTLGVTLRYPSWRALL